MRIVRIVILFVFMLPLAVWSQKNKNTQQNNPDVNKVLTAKEVDVISYYYEATTQKLLGNSKEALSLYLLCISKDPKNAGAHFEAAHLYNELKQPSTGVTYAKEAASLDPKNKWFLGEYADLLIQTGKVKQASKVYDQLLKIEPDNQDYQLQKADILIYLKQYKGAIAIYDKLEKKLGIVAEIVLQKQKLYLAQGKYESAEREMQRLVEAFPNEPEYYGMFAEFYLSINKKEKAMGMFQKVLELDPTNPIIHLAIANYYQENKQNDKAFEYIKLAFNNPEVPIDNKIKIMLSYYDLSAHNSERKKEAEELLDILLKVHPEEAKSWSVKGDFLLRDEKITEAISAYEKVLEIQNDKYPVWEQLLQLYIEIGRYDKLQTQSAKALELFPSMPLFYVYNGLGNFMMGNYEVALESYMAGKDLVINNPDQKTMFLIGIAEANTKLKKYSDAETSFESALNLQPKNITVLTSYAGYLCNIKKDLKKSSDLANQALLLEPQNYAVWDILALIQYKENNYSEALAAIITSIKYGGGTDSKILEHYGDILFKSGDETRALEEWMNAKAAKGVHSDLLDSKIQQKKLVE